VGLPGQDSIVAGYAHGYDDGTTGAEVVHKTTYGFVHTVNVVVSATAQVAGCTFEIRDGTGVAIWQQIIPAIGAAGSPMAFCVLLDCAFGTDIRTIVTAPAMGTMTVSYR
jgi:hypothetical protein